MALYRQVLEMRLVVFVLQIVKLIHPSVKSLLINIFLMNIVK